MRHVLLIDLADDAAAIAQYEAWHASGALPPASATSSFESRIGS